MFVCELSTTKLRRSSERPNSAVAMEALCPAHLRWSCDTQQTDTPTSFKHPNERNKSKCAKYIYKKTNNELLLKQRGSSPRLMNVPLFYSLIVLKSMSKPITLDDDCPYVACISVRLKRSQTAASSIARSVIIHHWRKGNNPAHRQTTHKEVGRQLFLTAYDTYYHQAKRLLKHFYPK